MQSDELKLGGSKIEPHSQRETPVREADSARRTGLSRGRRPKISALFKGLVIAVASLHGACGHPNTGGEVNSEAHSELSTTAAGCFNWSNVNKTLTGGGQFMSPATYNNGTCFKAYLLNLVDYDNTKYNAGAAVGYGGAIPIGEQACRDLRVRAIAWRRDGTTMVLEGDKTARGRWVIGYDNVGRCLPPQVHLERDLNVRPNGTRDFRIAMTARSAPGSEAPTVPVGFVTVEDHYRPPVAQLQDLRLYRDALDVGAGGTEPWLLTEWNNRNTPMGQMACRRLQIDKGLHAFARAALIKAGASAATVDARITALSNHHTQLCGGSGTQNGFRLATMDYITRTLAIFDEIRAALRAPLPAAYDTTTSSIAANLMAQIGEQALANLYSKCGLQQTPLMSYLLHGIMPTGVTDPTRVVLGTCSGQTPGQAASSIGFGAPTPGGGGAAAAVRGMAQCMAGLASDVTENRCNSPISEGAPENPEPLCWDADTGEEGCENRCWDPVRNDFCTPTQEAEVGEKKAADEGEKDKTKSTTKPLIEGPVPTPESKTEAISEEVREAAIIGSKMGVTGIGLVAGGVKVKADLRINNPTNPPPPAVLRDLRWTSAQAGAVAWTAAAGLFVLQLLDVLIPQTEEERQVEDAAIRSWCSTNPSDPLEVCDRHIGPQAYCPADPILPGGGWFEINTGNPNAHQANIQDLFNHCLCVMVDADYAAVGRGETPSRAPAPTCPRTEEQRMLECVADPRKADGPDDEPDPECYERLAPVYDYDAWRVKDCDRKLCPAMQQPYAMPDGECVCDVPNPTEGKPDCNITPMASGGLCTQENPEVCLCAPIAPPFPNGPDPLCRFNVNRIPGPPSGWMTPDVDALHAEVFNSTTNVIRVRAGGNTQFVTPTLFPNSFAQRGTRIRQKVILNERPALGQNVDLKLYYTNRSRNVFRQFLSQCRMNDFTVGSVTNCDFDLPTIGGVNAGTLQEPFEIEMELNTAVNYKTRPSLGALSFAGTITATPSNLLAPTCPDPAPGGGRLVEVVSPWNDWLDTITTRPIYPSPSGLLLEVPLTVPVVR